MATYRTDDVNETTAANRSMPTSSVIPVLSYPDVRIAVEWLCRCFGFVERLRIGDHRAQLSFGDGSIVVTGAPGSSGGDGSHSVMVRVPDVNRHYQHARASGVQTAGPPTDFPYGERQYSVVDIGGHAWTFSETIADIDPGTWGGVLVNRE